MFTLALLEILQEESFLTSDKHIGIERQREVVFTHADLSILGYMTTVMYVIFIGPTTGSTRLTPTEASDTSPYPSCKNFWNNKFHKECGGGGLSRQ